MSLAKKHCIPCEGGIPPLSLEKVNTLIEKIPNWEADGNSKLTRKLSFKDFGETMVFVNKMAEIAETEGHHPDISISYNKIELTLTTHAIGGLSENDFILAAKINTLL